MCFVNDDYDWFAQVWEETDYPATKPTRCCECRAMIQPGEMLHRIWMQQYEECHTCDEGECCCPDGKCCQCDKPNLGEEGEFFQCQDCCRFLECVSIAEREGGCDPQESCPALGMMLEQIGEGGAEEARKYARVALKRYPDLRPYIARIWRHMFGE